MCDICHRTPCMNRCPNAQEPEAVFICSGCGRKIYEDDFYWDILGEQFCEECIDGYREIAKREG